MNYVQESRKVHNRTELFTVVVSLLTFEVKGYSWRCSVEAEGFKMKIE